MIDPYSETWGAIKKHCQDKRKQYTEELIEGTPNDNHIRGRIQFIDELLRLEKPDKLPPIKTVTYL